MTEEGMSAAGLGIETKPKKNWWQRLWGNDED